MLEYNKPIEVTENQYRVIMTQLAGICAGKEEDGKFYIKLWMTKYKKNVQQVLDIIK